MSVANFIPEIWSQNLNLALRRTRVFESLVNRDYEGEIREQGNTVRITRPGAITISDYTGVDFNYDDVASAQSTLLIDQARKFAFQVDDVDAVQANTNLISTYTNEAGQAMGDDTDDFLAGQYVDAHADNVIAKVAYTKDTIYGAFVEASRRLNKKHVPQPGRWAAVSPEILALLLQAPEFIKASDLGDRVVMEGAIGMVAGFSVYMSNGVVTANDGVNDVQHNLLGTRAAITFAEQLVKVEALRLQNSFKDGIRGLHLYGARVVKAEALIDLRHQTA